MLSEQLKSIIEKYIDLIEQYRFNELYKRCPYDETRNELTEIFTSIGLDPLSIFKKEIPKYAYLGNIHITEARIPEGIIKIDLGAFHKCANLQKVYLPESLEDLSLESFSKCPELEHVYYEGSSADWYKIKWSLNPFNNTPVTHIVCKDETIEWNPYAKEQ